MTGKELFEQFKNGARPIVCFTRKVEDYECFDPNMKARLLSIYEDEDTLCCIFDFTEFEDYNKAFEMPVWIGKNGEYLKWSESPYYPKDKRVKIYVGYDDEPCFVLENASLAYQDYKASGSTLTYIQWLEEQYRRWQTMRKWLSQAVVQKYEDANEKNGQEQLVASSVARGMDEVLIKIQHLEQESHIN